MHATKDCVPFSTFLVKTTYCWDYYDFIEYCENKEYNKLNFNVVYTNEQNKVAVLEIQDFETMSIIGNKSSWCISRYVSSWSEYVITDEHRPKENTHQYIFFDFNKEYKSPFSMVAFTTNYNNTKFLRAHLLNNDYAMLKNGHGEEVDVISITEEFLSRDKRNISSILLDYGITLGKIFNNYPNPKFEWNIKSFLKFASENNISNVEANIEKNACLIPLQIINNEINFNILFDNIELLDREGLYRNSINNHIVLFLDFNKPLTDITSTLMLTDVKSICSYDYIINCEAYNGTSVRYDTYNLLNSLNLTNDILKAKNYTKLDEACYYLSNALYDKFFELINKDANIFNQLTTYRISNVMIALLFTCVLHSKDIDLVKKVINSKNILGLFHSFSCETDISSVLSILLEKTYDYFGNNEDNDISYYIFNTVFSTIDESIDTNNDFYLENSIISHYVSFLAKENRNIRYYKLFEKYKLYEKKILLAIY